MIAVTVKEFLWKEVAVRIRYKGRMKRGLKLIRQVVPEKVMIYGYKSRIASIDTVYATESIDLSQVVESKTVKLPLQKREEILKFGETEEVCRQRITNQRGPFPLFDEDPQVAYGVAESYAALFRPRESLRWLEIAFELGYSDYDGALDSDGFSVYEDDDRFVDLVQSF